MRLILALTLLGLAMPGAFLGAHEIDPFILEKARLGTLGVSEDIEGIPADKAFAAPILESAVHIGDGYILTARHGVKKEREGTLIILRTIRILTAKGGQFRAHLIGENEFMDLALYRVASEYIDHLPDSLEFSAQDIFPGIDIFTVGNPLRQKFIITFGHLSQTKEKLPILKIPLLRLDLFICSGNSGGGVFNGRGEIIGIIHSIFQIEHVPGLGGCGRTAFAIPTAIITRAIEALKENREPQFPWLGAATYVDFVGNYQRLIIEMVYPDGPAALAGLEKNDVILAMEGTEIHSESEWLDFIFNKVSIGQSVRLQILRQGKNFELIVVLATKP